MPADDRFDVGFAWTFIVLSVKLFARFGIAVEFWTVLHIMISCRNRWNSFDAGKVMK